MSARPGRGDRTSCGGTRQRTRGAKRSREALDAGAVRLAVIASVRHVDTEYDEPLMSGVDRESARVRVHQRVDDIVNAWRDGAALLDG